MIWKGILFAFLAVGAVYLATHALPSPRFPSVLFLGCVVFSAWHFGTLVGAFAASLACVLSVGYLSSWNYDEAWQSVNFAGICAVVIYLNHQRLKALRDLAIDRRTADSQKGKAFTDAIELMSSELADLLTVVVSHAEMALPMNSEDLAQIRAAGIRGGRVVAQLQLMAQTKKHEL